VFFVALGHTLLAMSGEEALAQVYREIEAPKQKNLKKAAFVIFVVSIFFTAFVSFACYSIVPEAQRLAAGDNLLNQLVLNFAGPAGLKLCMVGFVVLVGALILAGAVNTSIFASNSVLNRVAEDGILADWFRVPHHRFGSTYRVIHLVGILQVVTILVSMGDVHLLGEAYAFGVIWSFVFMTVSMFILRFKYRGKRAISMPLNLKIGTVKWPLGIGIVCFILIGVAVTNLFTKKVATISGISFTSIFFCIFVASDRYNRRRRRGADPAEHTEKFILDRRPELTADDVPPHGEGVRILVPIRDPHNLAHLKQALQKSHERKSEIVVMTVKVDRTYRENAEQVMPGEGDKLFNEGEGMFTTDEQTLFSKVVELAETYGEQVIPIVVPSNNAWFAIARTAQEIEADEILLGMSEKISPDVQLQQLALMWGIVSSGDEKELTLRIVKKPGEEFVATL
jgi:hypothetical protein